MLTGGVVKMLTPHTSMMHSHETMYSWLQSVEDSNFAIRISWRFINSYILECGWQRLAWNLGFFPYHLSH